jgi:hypothetical protein
MHDQYIYVSVATIYLFVALFVLAYFGLTFLKRISILLIDRNAKLKPINYLLALEYSLLVLITVVVIHMSGVPVIID